MKEERASLNQLWASTLIEQLVLQGVEYFCLAPGNRVSPLAVAVSKEKRANVFVHFDERGLGFHALGIAKATKKPVALLVTSGTAVGNLMPAVMEASLSAVALILLTSDRPSERLDVKANQTAEQSHFFGSYVRYRFDLPSPSSHLPLRFLHTTIAQAFTRSLYPIKGPVHLNCPYPEPLLGEEEIDSLKAAPTHYTLPELSLSEDSLQRLAQQLNEMKKGVILIGFLEEENLLPIYTLAKRLKFPIFPDITSSYRTFADTTFTINYYPYLLKTFSELRVDGILHLGDQFVSSSLLQWMGQHVGQNILHVSMDPRRCDPLHLVSERVIASPSHFCEKILPYLMQNPDEGPLLEWKERSQAVEAALSTSLEKYPSLTEPGVIQVLLEEEEVALFIGNSMPIRDADMLFFPRKKRGPLFTNRGLSGIDGNIATAAGIAQKYPVIAVIGDQTCLHDLNSLALLKKIKYPVTLIVINNGGGGIFSFVLSPHHKNTLDTYFAAAHPYHFEEAAKLFQLPYIQVKTKEELTAHLKKGVSSLIEVITSRSENLLLHETLDLAVYEALCSSSSTVF